MVLCRESQTSQSVFLMIGTVFGGRNTSEYVSQEQKSFTLGDLEENMSLRMELPWNLPHGRYVAVFELLDPSALSLETGFSRRRMAEHFCGAVKRAVHKENAPKLTSYVCPAF